VLDANPTTPSVSVNPATQSAIAITIPDSPRHIDSNGGIGAIKQI